MKTWAFTLIVSIVLSTGAAAQKTGEWAKGIPFHTDWKSAIEEVRNTGKLLFIYNGWQKKGT